MVLEAIYGTKNPMNIQHPNWKDSCKLYIYNIIIYLIETKTLGQQEEHNCTSQTTDELSQHE